MGKSVWEVLVMKKWQVREVDISFVIPVYNGEKCIEECVNSILTWNWKQEIEILVIDDGSTDGTAGLCRKMEEKDKRIMLFSIANSGQSIARNYGMRRCGGRYICFADADDTINAKEVSHMWEIAEREEADVVMGAYFRVNGAKRERIHLAGEGIIARKGTPEEKKLYRRVRAESAFGYVWNKLYRKEFLDKHKLRMDDIRKIYMEDQLFNLKVWSKNPVWYCCDRPVYYYDTKNVSTTRKSEPEIHTKNIALIDELTAYYEENGNLQENLDVLLPLIMRSFCWSLVKNIAYEGKGMAKIKERAEAYMCSENVRKVIGMRGAVRKLWGLPSALQAAFYSVCLVLIRWRWSGCVSIIFYFTYPVMKKYILKVVK